MMSRFLSALAMASLLALAAAARAQAPAAAPVSAPTPIASTPAQLAAPPSKARVQSAAVQAAPVQAAADPMAGPSAGNLLQTIFGLCVVLALLALFAWAMKRYGPKATGASAHLRVVGALNLGGRERIMVVEVGDQWIVVGASPGRVNALATMAKQEGVLADATLAGHAPAAATFSDWLKQTIDKRNAR